MCYYYVAVNSRSYVFLLENRLTCGGVPCEITHSPRALAEGLCNVSIRFANEYFAGAANIIANSGIPGCRIFKEVRKPEQALYFEVRY